MDEHATRMARAHLRFNRRFHNLLDALEELDKLRVLDPQRIRHARLVLEHSRARLNLDIAEWAQELELTKCNETDRELRRLESALDRNQE